jgi:Fanconi anemia group M protein
MIIDHREKGSVLAQGLETLMEVEYQALPVGDYTFGDYGVERKTLQDLVLSLKDKRLARQRVAMKTTYPRPLFLITGTVWEAGLSSTEVNAIASILREGVTVFQIEDEFDAAKLLYRLAQQSGAARSPKVSKLSSWPDDERRQLIYIVSALPGVGAVRAQALLDRFGSLEKLFSADEKALLEVPGIGKRGANDIYKLFRKEFPAEGT